MFLRLSLTHRPATDLGFLVHKNPARSHEFALAFGKAVVFFPEAGEDRCTLCMVLDVDPIGLVRGRAGHEKLADQYVNDRPYAASSFLSVAIARTMRDALVGRSRERQELAETALPFEACVTPLKSRGGAELVERLFAPLGYAVTVETHPLDPDRPDWGPSPYVTLRLGATIRISDLLSHLYVLMPVLDDRKHYFVGEEELEKLLAKGEGWLAGHPERELIAARYLKRRRSLVREALERLSEPESGEPETLDPTTAARAERAIEAPLRLHDERLDLVAGTLEHLGVRRVLDLGCGDGRLIMRLARKGVFSEIIGVEVSTVALERAKARIAHLPERSRSRVGLLHGSLIYRDARIEGFDAAALVEVIEHIDPERLPHLETAVFGAASPGVVIVTTPNRDYNPLFPTLPAGMRRHADHRFEWSRAEFQDWATRVAADFNYTVTFSEIGTPDPERGAPSQMAVFSR